MADTLFLELVSPEKKFVSLDISSIEAMGAGGAFGIFPGHTPFCTELVPCKLIYRVGQETFTYAVSGGFFEVVDDKVNVLANRLIPSSDINKEELKKEQDQLNDELSKETDERKIKILEQQLLFINIALNL